MDDTAWQIDGPYPPRGAAAWLRQRMTQILAQLALPIGEPVPSERDLMRRTGISRSAVRRAIDSLVAEGWLERRPGVGLFVGHRRILPASLLSGSHGDETGARIAVVIHKLGALVTDWYSHGVLAGMDVAARAAGLLLDPIGSHERDAAVLMTTIERHRPDALVLIGSSLEHAMISATARRLGIPTIATGVRMAALNPVVAKDATQGLRLGTEHLIAAGHRRIACIVPTSYAWAFERLEGWRDAHRVHDLPCDARDIVWLTRQPFAPGPRPRPDAVTELVNVLRHRRPTALVVTSSMLLADIAKALDILGWKVPADCSLVTYEQDIAEQKLWFGDLSFTTINQPIEAMGTELARLTVRLLRRQSVPAITWVPCTLTPGDSVRRHEFTAAPGERTTSAAPRRRRGG